MIPARGAIIVVRVWLAYICRETFIVYVATPHPPTNGQPKMNLENEIKDILFEIGKEIKVHKLIDGNLIIEIDYDKYTISIMELIKKYLSND